MKTSLRLSLVMVLMLMFTTLSIFTLSHQGVLAQDDDPGSVNTPTPQYDPSIHFYVEGLEIGSMNDHIKAGSLSELLTSGVYPRSVEAGSWFYPRGEKSIVKYQNNVRWNSCGGSDDAWVDYYYINENELWSNDIVVWSWNVLSRTHINNQNPPGLHGGYYCVGGPCTISVCATQFPGADPSSVYISYN